MKSFKDYLVEFDTPQIYCDMDGVLVDFVKYTSEHLGQSFTDEKWTELPVDMFYRMPPMSDAKVLWNFIGKYDPFILLLFQENHQKEAQFQNVQLLIRNDG